MNRKKTITDSEKFQIIIKLLFTRLIEDLGPISPKKL